MNPLLLALGLVIGIYAVYMRATGNDPAYEIASAIGDSLRTVSESLANAITETVNVILAPIRIPATYLASGLAEFSTVFGAIAALFLVLMYFYTLTALAFGRKPDRGFMKFLAIGLVLGAVLHIAGLG